MTGTHDVRLTAQLIDSHRRLTGRPLAPQSLTGEAAAAFLYGAPFGLLVHDTSADPLFVYANRTAQELFGYGWEEFVGLPSRLSAGVQDRESRRVFMESVLRDGFADSYRGQRVRKDGSRFHLEDATVWNVLDAGSTLIGQAAVIRRWSGV